MIAGGKERVLKFFDMSQIKFIKNSSVTTADIQNFKFDELGEKIYVVGTKYLRVYESQSQSTTALKSFETTWKKPRDVLIFNKIVYVVSFSKRTIYLY